MRPQPARFVFRHEPEARPEIEQNISRLCDHQLASFKKRRRKGRVLNGAAFHKTHHCRHAALGESGNIYVVGARIFQRQPDKLAAALYFRPVVQFVTHRGSPS